MVPRWRSTIEFDEVKYDVGGIRLLLPHEVPDGQLGYALAEDGESLTGTASGDWQPDWVVIGNETACGDPIFASNIAPHPVFTAMHGEGSWDPCLIAPGLGAFSQCLIAFRAFSAERGNPVAVEANPPTLQQQAEFLRAIREMAGSRPDTLDFWTVQIGVDLDTFDT